MSKHSRVKHTYEFYRNRRTDPNWREDYFKARDMRIFKFLVTVVLILALVIGYELLHSQQLNLNSVTNSPKSTSSSVSSTDSSQANQTDDRTDPDEYQKMSAVGQYTVSTEELNGVASFTANLHPGTNNPSDISIKFNLDNDSGDGTYTNLGGAMVGATGSESAHYQEIKTKQLTVTNSQNETRTVKVNTAVIDDDGKVLAFAFKNNQGSISVTFNSGEKLLEMVPTNQFSN